MSTELLINVTPSESRVALIENGVLQEIQLERIGNLGIVGNIYLGKISHKDELFEGQHGAIVGVADWNAVQEMLEQNRLEIRLHLSNGDCTFRTNFNAGFTANTVIHIHK